MKLKRIHSIIFNSKNMDKNTENSETIAVPLPEKVVISMCQSKGEGCKPLVKKGDAVFVGQKIGEPSDDFGCPVHSSVSGEVEDIEEIFLPDGRKTFGAVIKTDGKQTVSGEINPPDVTDKNGFVEMLKESGCVEPDGTPTYSLFDGDVKTLIVSGGENEPFVTSNYRCMIEDYEKVTESISLIKNSLQIDKVIVAIDGSFRDAPELFKEKIDEIKDTDVILKKLNGGYPQFDPQILVYKLTENCLKHGQKPLDYNTAIVDISSVAFICDYMRTGIPLINKRLTVEGDIVKTPCNVLAPVGISLKNLLDFAETNFEFVKKIVVGGVMTGFCVTDYETPVCKTYTSVLAFKEPIDDKKHKEMSAVTNCIKCGRCSDGCPVGLYPQKIEKAYDKKNVKRLEKLNPQMCIKCGGCSYVCPAKRELAYKVQLAEGFLKNPQTIEKGEEN